MSALRSFIDVDDDFFDRLEHLAVLALLHDDARAGYGKLEAFAAHGLDEDGELQFATAGDVERVLAFGFLDLQRDVAFGFLEQAIADDAARDLVAFGAGKRAVIDDEGHGDGRRIDRLCLQRFIDGRVAERIGDRALRKAGDGNDVACLGFFDRLTLDTAEREDLGNSAGLDRLTVGSQYLHGLVRLDGAGMDAAGDDAAEERVGFEQRADHAERTFADFRLGHVLHDKVEKRCKTLVRRTFRRGVHPAGAAGAVENGEVQLLVIGVERGEEVKHLVDDFFCATIGTIDLVDRHDRAETDLQRLADHEFRLRHRAFGGIDQNDRAVDHRENALDLTAEVGVTRRVDDVDAVALPLDRRRLGKDRDAAFLFQVVGIHHALCCALVLTEGAGLLEELVDERGLAMVDVCDDRDIAHGHGNVSELWGAWI
jgi:hypothetical protein